MLKILLDAKGTTAASYFAGGVALLVVLMTIPEALVTFSIKFSLGVALIWYFHHVWGERIISLLRGEPDGNKPDASPNEGEGK